MFWQSDQVQSCMPVDQAAGCEQLDATWHNFFEALPGGARILDLGTGNGSLASQAAAVSLGKTVGFDIHGVDLADISPADYVSCNVELLKSITFHSDTAMEALPFPDAHFDAITSQYALEYSHTEKSVREMMRVLKANGSFRFLMHAQDAVLQQRCQLQHRQADAILASDLFPQLQDTLKQMYGAQQYATEASMNTAKKAILKLKELLDELELTVVEDDDRSIVENLITAIKSLLALRKTHSQTDTLAMAATSRTLLVAQSKRLHAMENASMSDTQLRELEDEIMGLGVSRIVCTRATESDAGNYIGYWLSGQKCEAGKGRKLYA